MPGRFQAHVGNELRAPERSPPKESKNFAAVAAIPPIVAQVSIHSPLRSPWSFCSCRLDAMAHLP